MTKIKDKMPKTNHSKLAKCNHNKMTKTTNGKVTKTNQNNVTKRNYGKVTESTQDKATAINPDKIATAGEVDKTEQIQGNILTYTTIDRTQKTVYPDKHTSQCAAIV